MSDDMMEITYGETAREPGLQDGNVIFTVEKLSVSAKIKTATGEYFGSLTLSGQDVSVPLALPVAEGATPVEDTISMDTISIILQKVATDVKEALLAASKPEADF